jgi:shikimate kinase
MTTFSITFYYDPFGDGKSKRRILKRSFFHSEKPEQEIRDIFKKRYSQYGQFAQPRYLAPEIIFKYYKKTNLFT